MIGDIAPKRVAPGADRGRVTFGARLLLVSSILLQSTAMGLSRALGLDTRGQDPLALLHHPLLFLIFSLLALQAITWLLALRECPLSIAYPSTASVFALNLLLAGVVFGESVGPSHLLGTALIVAGVALALSSSTPDRGAGHGAAGDA